MFDPLDLPIEPAWVLLRLTLQLAQPHELVRLVVFVSPHRHSIGGISPRLQPQ